MTALGFLLSLLVAFAVGWFLCSYFEQQARIDRRRRARIIRAAAQDERVAR